MNNLLVHLHRWVSRQDENFTTEALAHLLKHLRDHKPEVAARLLKKMTDDTIGFDRDEMRLAQITTQVTTPEGRPDIEIRTASCLVYIEAKVESGLGRNQLKRYRQRLDTEQNRLGIRTALVLLTRYPISAEAVEVKPDAMVRWHNVGAWLFEERQANTIGDPVSVYLVEQFLEYLKTRSMIMEPVSWEIVRGARSFRDLMLMLKESVVACQLSSVDAYAFDYFGFNLDRSRYFLGVYYDRADKVIFYTRNVHIDPQADKKLGFGSIWERKSSPGGWAWAWEHHLDLCAEDVHFFARSLASQKKRLEEFIGACLSAAKIIEIPAPSETLAALPKGPNDSENAE